MLSIKISLFAVIIIACVVVAAAAGVAIGIAYRKKVAEATIGSAQQEATRIVNDAVSKAESKKKEAILEAKDEIHRQRNELERELRERRSEVQRQERRIAQKEESLDRKTENIERKDEQLNNKIKAADKKAEEIELVNAVRLKCSKKFQASTRNRLRIICLKLLSPILYMRKRSRLWNMSRKQRMKQTRKLVKLLQPQFSAVPQIIVPTPRFRLLHCPTMR